MTNLIKKFKESNKGFTMVELIVVIAIIAVLAIVVAPAYLKYVETARRNSDIQTAVAIEKAINVLVSDGTIDLPPSGKTTEITWAANPGSLNKHDVVIGEIVGSIARKSSATPAVTWTIDDSGKVTSSATGTNAYDKLTAWTNK